MRRFSPTGGTSGREIAHYPQRKNTRTPCLAYAPTKSKYKHGIATRLSLVRVLSADALSLCDKLHPIVSLSSPKPAVEEAARHYRHHTTSTSCFPPVTDIKRSRSMKGVITQHYYLLVLLPEIKRNGMHQTHHTKITHEGGNNKSNF